MDKRATKRKRVVLTIEDKLKVCRLAKQNVPKFVLMNQFKIGKSTLNDILRSEEKLTKCLSGQMLIRSRFWKKVAQHDRIIEDVL